MAHRFKLRFTTGIFTADLLTADRFTAGMAGLSLVPFAPRLTLAQVHVQPGVSQPQGLPTSMVSQVPVLPSPSPTQPAKTITASPVQSTAPSSPPSNRPVTSLTDIPPAETPAPETVIPANQAMVGLGAALLLTALVALWQYRLLHQAARLRQASGQLTVNRDFEVQIPSEPSPPEPSPPEPSLPEPSPSEPSPSEPSPPQAAVMVGPNSAPSLAPLKQDGVTLTTRLAKIDGVEALIGDLHSLDGAQRRKAIWELGQRGDSRAVQPLVDLIVDSDSQQRSLILAAVAEISSRTLKPMNRALLLSLQDESAEVRKNAIRDITRIYELMSQASQLLHYAANDTDTEVQETAHWALNQLHRLRSVPDPVPPLFPEQTAFPEQAALNPRQQTRDDTANFP
jgi:hypothetical protein